MRHLSGEETTAHGVQFAEQTRREGNEEKRNDRARGGRCTARVYARAALQSSTFRNSRELARKKLEKSRTHTSLSVESAR